jgi:indolepyruvate ferredoxin oxidoreductase beta subunit
MNGLSIASPAIGSKDHTTTVLLCGVGGQGTILAGDLLAITSRKSGLSVKVSEVHGMAQRGGAVTTIVRFGTEVASPITDYGCVDCLVAFEATEALRNLPYLAPDGVLFVNDATIDPLSVLVGTAAMPTGIHAELQANGAHLLSASAIAAGLGNPKSVNVVLVGALSVALSFPVSDWEDAIEHRVPPKTVEANLAAFRAGRVAGVAASHS